VNHPGEQCTATHAKLVLERTGDRKCHAK
jgi:hypothetical protein